ncbi:MAG: phosphodiester glycosidase family protein [Verrucomicrobiota bacterium]
MTVFAGLFLLLAAWPADTNAPVAYWHEQRQQPRPLQIHFLRIDLSNPTIAVNALVADDPDGAGPAEAQLENPLDLAARGGVMAAVNANAFNAVPPLAPGEQPHWVWHLPIDIKGWAQLGATVRSLPVKGWPSIWIDPAGRGHVGIRNEPAPAQAAAAGFGQLLRDGQSVVGTNQILHPRTAAGVDREGFRLWLLVVDGRQPNYSEGATESELAGLMKEVGCWDALNLDGGGSSIMLLSTNGTNLSIMNRPSGGTPRPVPVMLGIKSGASADRR